MRITIPNSIIYQDSETTIILLESSVHGKMHCSLDTEDYLKIKKYRYHIIKQKNVYYAARGYYKNGDHNKHSTIFMHREILSTRLDIDHKDGIGLHNKKSNLRPCTNSQNQLNRSIDKRNKTGYKGVFLPKNKNKFYASIRINNKAHFLGLFNDDISAARAYDAAALEHFGEFARLNNV